MTCATQIQKVWRGFLARRVFGRIVDRRQAAARRIQRVGRLYLTRVRLRLRSIRVRRWAEEKRQGGLEYFRTVEFVRIDEVGGLRIRLNSRPIPTHSSLHIEVCPGTMPWDYAKLYTFPSSIRDA